MQWTISLRRPQSSVSQRTYIQNQDILSKAQSLKKIEIQKQEIIDPSIPKGRGEGLGLPEFLKKRAMMPKIQDPLDDGIEKRLQAGDPTKANPQAQRPVEPPVFKLKQIGEQPYQYEQKKSEKKPPKAVYVHRDRKELYDHKLVQKPFNWYNQKRADQLLKEQIQQSKKNGNLVDIQHQIIEKVIQSKDIMKNFDKENYHQDFSNAEETSLHPDQKKEIQYSQEIWDAFGKYIKKNLQLGRAINIPKFGIFTFTFPNHLKLGGLTNPNQRDLQIRTPVFILSKDFIHGTKIIPGIAGSWAFDIYIKQQQNLDFDQSSTKSDIRSQINKNKIIPFDQKDEIGIIPKHDINYIDVSQLTNNPNISKSVAQEHCELIFKQFSHRARAHHQIMNVIPFVGKFAVQNGRCAVIFNQEIIESVRGKTAINYKDRHHSADIWNNLKNNKILEKDNNKYTTKKTKMDAYKEKLDQEFEQNIQLKEIEIESFQLQKENDKKQQSKRPQSAYQALQNKQSLKSFRSNQLSVRELSKFSGSFINSNISNVPDLEESQLVRITNYLAQQKGLIIEKCRENKIGLREQLTSSKILKILNISRIPIQLYEIKGLLKALGFKYNGSSCSITQLVNASTQYSKSFDQFDQSKNRNAIKVVKELLNQYKSTLYQIAEPYFQFNSQNKQVIYFQSYKKLLTKIIQEQKSTFGDILSDNDIINSFQLIQKKNTEFITFQEFSNTFQIDKKIDNDNDIINNGEQKQNALEILRDIIQQKNLSKEQVLSQLTLSVNDKPLDYNQFKSAIIYFYTQFTEVQINHLYNKLKDSKSGKVEINHFIRYLCGQEYDMIHTKQSVYKTLYKYLVKNNKFEFFQQMLEKADSNHDGKLMPMQVEILLKQILNNEQLFQGQSIQDVVKLLITTKEGKIDCSELIQQMCYVSNRNHNPVQFLVKRISQFMKINNLDTKSFLKNMNSNEIEISEFAKYIYQKVNDQNLSIEKIQELSKMIDIDKDGYINENDLQTCIDNLQSLQFFLNGGSNMKNAVFNTQNNLYVQNQNSQNLQKFEDIKQKVYKILAKNQQSYQKIFTDYDTNNDKFLNLNEFSKAINSITPLNSRTLESIFNFIDTNKIGMINFDQFFDFFNIQKPTYQIITNLENRQPLPEQKVTDSFEWQQNAIKQMKEWFRRERASQRDLELTAMDAFKSFDIDFDGKVSKQDLIKALTSLIKVPQSQINDINIDRLFKILSFYNQDYLQPSDFQRLFSSDSKNPFCVLDQENETLKNFKKSMGGAFIETDVHDWKLQAIKSIGLVISKNYSSIEESFDSASQNLGQKKINFQQFKNFIQKHNALEGYSITEELLQKLFSELDPHKKTNLNLQDWKNAFTPFNNNQLIIMEYKNQMQCTFKNSESAFRFYLIESKQDDVFVNFDQFYSQTQRILFAQKYSKQQIDIIFKAITLFGNYHSKFNLGDFQKFFANVKFTGNQKVYNQKDQILESIGKIGEQQIIKKCQLQQSFDKNILPRLRLLIHQSGKSLDEIFKKFDENDSGQLSISEFKKALRSLNIGLTILEINEIVQLVDKKDIKGHTRYDLVKGDGKIDFDEFASKLYNIPENENRMIERSKEKLSLLKEQMILYMSSHQDAFRMFNQQKKGFMTFQEFEKLIDKLSEYTPDKLKLPNFSVLKDIFDTIDIDKDGLLSIKEWKTIFLKMGQQKSKDNQQISQTFGVKSAVINNENNQNKWYNSQEYQRLIDLIAKNRNNLIKQFKEQSTHSSFDGQPKYVNFQQAKKALSNLINEFMDSDKYIQINDQKIAMLLEPGLINKKLSSEKPKLIPAFGDGYYEERPQKYDPNENHIYDFNKLLNVYKERYERKVSIF